MDGGWSAAAAALSRCALFVFLCSLLLLFGGRREGGQIEPPPFHKKPPHPFQPLSLAQIWRDVSVKKKQHRNSICQFILKSFRCPGAPRGQVPLLVPHLKRKASTMAATDCPDDQPSDPLKKFAAKSPKFKALESIGTHRSNPLSTQHKDERLLQ